MTQEGALRDLLHNDPVWYVPQTIIFPVGVSQKTCIILTPYDFNYKIKMAEIKNLHGNVIV